MSAAVLPLHQVIPFERGHSGEAVGVHKAMLLLARQRAEKIWS